MYLSSSLNFNRNWKMSRQFLSFKVSKFIAQHFETCCFLGHAWLLRRSECSRKKLCFGLWCVALFWLAFYLNCFYLGNEPWPANLKLKFVKGQNFSHGETVVLTPAEPQQTIELRINMIAPSQDGLYQGQWRGVTLNGAYFGS